PTGEPPDPQRGPPWRDGPPWRGGPPWSEEGRPEDWRAYRREMWRRRQQWRGDTPWRRGPTPVFGCLFFLFFVLFVGWIVASVVALISSIGTPPALLLGVVAIVLVALVGRRLNRSARTLDDLVDATARVEAGD